MGDVWILVLFITDSRRHFYDAIKKITFSIDPSNIIAETDETNNDLAYVEPNTSYCGDQVCDRYEMYESCPQDCSVSDKNVY